MFCPTRLQKLTCCSWTSCCSKCNAGKENSDLENGDIPENDDLDDDVDDDLMEGPNNITTTNQTLLLTTRQREAVDNQQTSIAPQGDTAQVALLVQ